MISKAQLQFVQSLKIKKFRQVHKACLAEGRKMTRELLNSNVKVLQIYALESWIREHQQAIGKRDIQAEPVDEKALKKLSALKTPPEVVAVAEIPEAPEADHPFVGSVVLALESVRDPGNLGTIIRSAVWYGLDEIVCSPDTADCYNPKVIQASMGSIFRVNLRYADLEKVFRINETWPVWGAGLEGKNIHNTAVPAEGFWLFGNEGMGISAQLSGSCNAFYTIPGSGKAESLNVAVSAGIFMDHIVRNAEGLK